MLKTNAFLLPLLVLPAYSGDSSSQPASSTAAAESRFSDTLTGDWGGLRSRLADNGVRFDLSYTQYYNGLFSGDGYDDWDFGGRVDAFLRLDSGKLGLWEGGGLHTHLEARFGESPSQRGGALWPVHTGSILPLGERGDLVASSLYFSQKLGSSGTLMLGKINAVDLLAGDAFFGGWGRDRFQNIAFVAPPSGVVPPTFMGAVFSYKAAPLTWTFMAFDPQDRTRDYCPDDLFDNGVNLSLGATWSGEIAGRASSVGITGTYSTKDGADLGEILLPPELKTSTKDGSYNVAVSFSHLLHETSPGKGLGIYGKAAIADGNPNPIRASFVGGLSGHGVVPGRPRDSFGIGAFYYDFSNDLQDTVSPLANFDDEMGVELFYNCAVTPWLRVTADLQIIDPASGDNDAAVVGGLRASIAF
jgi:porin